MTKENSNSLKIKRLPYSRLLKAEVADYSERVIAIIEDYKPKSIFINQLLGLLLKKRGDINLLRLNYGVDTERLKAKNQKEDMLLKISMFKLKARMLDRVILESELHILNNAIKTFLCNLHKCKNDKVLNQKVSGFFDMVANNEKLAYTIEKYKLKAEIDQVFASHKIYNSIVERRVKLLSERPKVSSRAISKDLLNRIDHLFQGVELAYMVSLELGIDEDVDSHEDLASLLNTLNQLSMMYYKSAKLREQNNQRKTSMEHGDDSDTATSNEISSETTFDGVFSSAEVTASALSVKVDTDQDVEVEALPKRLETNTINRNATLLLRCDPQKKIVKHSNTNINTKALNTCALYTKLKESSG